MQVTARLTKVWCLNMVRGKLVRIQPADFAPSPKVKFTTVVFQMLDIIVIGISHAGISRCEGRSSRGCPKFLGECVYGHET